MPLFCTLVPTKRFDDPLGPQVEPAASDDPTLLAAIDSVGRWFISTARAYDAAQEINRLAIAGAKIALVDVPGFDIKVVAKASVENQRSAAA